jgi:lipopolysaccharide/colanic/teichoic acid biosynthesis glycosyltransferase
MRRVLADAAVTWTGRVHVSAGFTDLLTTGVRISARNHVPLLTLKKVALTSAEAAAKRTLDCVLAALLLAILSPVLLVTALRLRAAGAGAALRRRTVLGRRGVPFDMPTFDPRGSASGFVRKLPALACVLRGDLSIVGPRPIPVDEAGRRDVPTIRPGLTGIWRETDSPTEQATLDLYYIRSYSLWMDLHVLWVRARARLLPGRPRTAHRTAAAATAAVAAGAVPEPAGRPHGAA